MQSAIQVAGCGADFGSWSLRWASALLAGVLLLGLGSQASAQVFSTPLLNEVRVNPPGANDAPYEFLELKAPAGTLLSNVWLVVLDGDSDSGGDPGTVEWARNLTGVAFGSAGLLVVTAPDWPYPVPPGTTGIQDSSLSRPGGALGNGTCTVLLLTTTAQMVVGEDLDRGDNAVLEGLPEDAAILDGVGWKDGDKGDRVYASAVLDMKAATPDAAVRLPGNLLTNSTAAWFCGDLVGSGPEAILLEWNSADSTFPQGTALTPGAANALAPVVSAREPVSGVIGDPHNPLLEVAVTAAGTAPDQLTVYATSTNAAVVPSSNLLVTRLGATNWTVRLDPVGVGYSSIELFAWAGVMTGRVAVPYAASAPGRPGGVWHVGASDGSTALPLGADFILLGDDENQTLRLYERPRSALPLRFFDFTAFLGLPDASGGLPREVDIEASTRAGYRAFWMGSHGHGAEGETRTNRTRVFATDILGSGPDTQLAYVGRYDYLKADLIEWDKNNLHGRGANYFGLEASDAVGVPSKAPDGSGFAIEGLCMVPGNNNAAFLAFRAPIVPPTNRTYALVLPVLNFTQLAAGNLPAGSSSFGPPIELDLYGRGIRSIESSSNGCAIIGGPAGSGVGPYPQDFRLYTWSGNPADAPQQRAADLAELNPEGVVGVPPAPWTASSEVEVLSDNGATEFYGDGVSAKRLTIPNFKKCRSDRLALGSVVKPIPVLTSWQHLPATGKFTVTWRALRGETYVIEASRTLEQSSWHEVGSVVASQPYASADLPMGAEWSYFRVGLPE